MFIGHIGVGLALKRAEPKRNLIWFLFATFFADLLLWILVLAGIEQAATANNYEKSHYLTFQFPYSHSLLATLIWSNLFFFTSYFISRSVKSSLMLSFAVLVHFIFDALVHIPELPIAGNDSPLIGLGMEKHINLSTALEVMLMGIGFLLYTHKKKYKMGLFLLIITFLFIAGQLFGPTPSSSAALAASSLFTLIPVIIIAGYLDKSAKL